MDKKYQPKYQSQKQKHKTLYCCESHPNSPITHLYVCLTKECSLNDTTLRNRILCVECLTEQKHIGHTVYGLKKFQQFVERYNWSSTQSAKTVLEHYQQLRRNIEGKLDELSKKIEEIMTLRIHNTFEAEDKQQFIKNNHEQIFNSPALSMWNQMFQQKFCRKQMSSSQKIDEQTLQNDIINKVLNFKEQIINQQIQDINEVIQNKIEQAITNMQFITMKKQLTFNPDKMHERNVGLTLNRNKLEYVEKIMGQLSQIQCSEQFSQISHLQQVYKLAFGQVPIITEVSRSFKIQKIYGNIMIGIADAESRNIITSENNYQKFLDLVYGVAINNSGQIAIFQKQQQYEQIKFSDNFHEVMEGDVIQVTVHEKQSLIIFIKYSLIQNGTGRFNTNNTYSRNADVKWSSSRGGNSSSFNKSNKNVYKSVLATIQADFSGSSSGFFFPFAAVSTEGDEVRLVDNVESNNMNVRRTNSDSKHRLQKSSQYLFDSLEGYGENKKNYHYQCFGVKTEGIKSETHEQKQYSFMNKVESLGEAESQSSVQIDIAHSQSQFETCRSEGDF